jgi:CheY-like chemotaxis protein
MMLEEDATGTRLSERASKIRRASERCAKIVQTFLAMARQKPPERVEVDINAIVQAALDLTAYGARTTGISVERVLAPDLPWLDADADQLHQVMANLLVNAQQALQEVSGPRVLTVVTRRGSAAGTVEVEVADSGPGIPEEIRRRVFEPFYTNKPQGVGTGLGLSFSLGVVEAHGGKLELLDRSSGAAFRLTLPASRSRSLSPSVAGSVQAGAAQRGHALVVDDEPEITEMVAELLEGAGYRVHIAGSGETAKKQLAARDFDLILSDLRMPDVDGPALYAWVAAERPHLLDRLAFVTGDTLGPNAARFLASANRPCLEKPFTPKALRDFVERVRTPVEGML